jgi:hypothetical protein
MVGLHANIRLGLEVVAVINDLAYLSEITPKC